MKRLTVVFGIATICLVFGQLLPVLAMEKPPIIVVEGRTIVAFFPPVSKAKLDKDPDTNEAMADFQLYTNHVREPLKKAGIGFHEVYAHSFQVRVGKTLTPFGATKGDVGYYFVVPGRRPRIEYGVMTDADLLKVANEYFGIRTQ
jgi:hypothetical protein